MNMEYTANNPVPSCEYKGYILIWIEKFCCWCILDDRGNKVREPYWSTTGECKSAIDSGEAL